MDCWVFTGGLFHFENMLGMFVYVFCSESWIDFCLLGSDVLDSDGVQVGVGLVGLGQCGGQWWWLNGDWIVFAMSLLGFW